MKNFNKALNYAFLLLRFRPRSEAEVCRRLKKREYSLSIIKNVIKSLKSYNYINDQDFVELYINDSLEKGWGPIRVNVNLKKIGISQELRKEAVKKIEEKSDQSIKRLIERKIYFLNKNKPNLKSKKKKEKLIRFLTNKGFYYKDIFVHLEKQKRNEN